MQIKKKKSFRLHGLHKTIQRLRVKQTWVSLQNHNDFIHLLKGIVDVNQQEYSLTIS